MITRAARGLERDASPRLGGVLDSNGNMIQGSKGVDLTAAPTLLIGTDGNCFDVNGSSTITAIGASGRVGTIVKFYFNEALTLTHHAKDLVLPGQVDYMVEAGETLEFVEYSTGQWRCNSQAPAAVGEILLSTFIVPSTVALVDVTFDTTKYRAFRVQASNVRMTGQAAMALRFFRDGTLVTTPQYAWALDGCSSTSGVLSNGGTGSEVPIIPNYYDLPAYFEIDLYNAIQSDNNAQAFIRSGFYDSGTAKLSSLSGFVYDGTINKTLTGIRIYSPTDNITQGRFNVYGRDPL